MRNMQHACENDKYFIHNFLHFTRMLMETVTEGTSSKLYIILEHTGENEIQATH